MPGLVCETLSLRYFLSGGVGDWERDYEKRGFEEKKSEVMGTIREEWKGDGWR